MISIKKITAEETYPIRLEILRKNIPLPYKFNGDFDNETFHLGAFDNEKLISVSSFMKVDNPQFVGKQYQLRGMATVNEYQGTGTGKLMMQKSFEILDELNTQYLWCNARVIAVNFYKKQGFNAVGELFEIPLVGPHFVMVKKIN